MYREDEINFNGIKNDVEESREINEEIEFVEFLKMYGCFVVNEFKYGGDDDRW